MNRTCVRASWLWMIGLTLTGCVGEVSSEPDEPELEGAESAIINGTVDNGDPAVVMLRSGSSGYCSGTLVSPTVVVTAAHCVDGINASSVGFGVNGQSTPVSVSRQIANPLWDGTLEVGEDIAVLILSSAVNGVTPVPVSTDTSEARAGDTVRIVGFGNNTTSNTGFGTKREATLAAASIGASDGVSEDRFIKVGDSRGTQTCNGDSGGPVFFQGADGVEHLVGVTSFGYTGCRGGAFHTRVAAHTDFLSNYVPLTPPPDGGGGDDAGAGSDTQPPTVSLVSPANGSTITSGQRSIVFEATDDVAVADVVLNWAYNGNVVRCSSPVSPWRCTKSGSRYTFSANIGRGVRRFTAQATDTSGNATSSPQYSITLR